MNDAEIAESLKKHIKLLEKEIERLKDAYKNAYSKGVTLYNENEGLKKRIDVLEDENIRLTFKRKEV